MIGDAAGGEIGVADYRIHEVVGHADAVVGVLEKDAGVSVRIGMESRESFTELMKQAEHCGLRYPVTPNSTCWVCWFQCQLWPSELGSMRSHPTLNQTGELNAAYWRTRM